MLTPTRFGKGGIKLEKDIRDRIAPPYKDNAYNAYSTCFANTTYIAYTAYTASEQKGYDASTYIRAF